MAFLEVLLLCSLRKRIILPVLPIDFEVRACMVACRYLEINDEFVLGTKRGSASAGSCVLSFFLRPALLR
jgi:hypothetical protein